MVEVYGDCTMSSTNLVLTGVINDRASIIDAAARQGLAIGGAITPSTILVCGDAHGSRRLVAERVGATIIDVLPSVEEQIEQAVQRIAESARAALAEVAEQDGDIADVTERMIEEIETTAEVAMRRRWRR